MLRWAGNQKESTTPDDYDEKAKEEDWAEDDDRLKFSRFLFKSLMAKASDKANRLVQKVSLVMGSMHGDALYSQSIPSWRHKLRLD